MDVPLCSTLDSVEYFHVVEPFTGSILFCIEDGKNIVEYFLTQGRRVFSWPVKFRIPAGKIIVPEKLIVDGSRGGEIFKKLLHGGV